MAAVEALLALLGLLFLVIIINAALATEAEPAPPIEDLAAPYREGLHAAVRVQRAAQDLERQVYAEAARHVDGPSDGTGRS